MGGFVLGGKMKSEKPNFLDFKLLFSHTFFVLSFNPLDSHVNIEYRK